LQKIVVDCEDPKKKKDRDEAEKKLDDFQKLKSVISKEIKACRELIEDRNKVLKGAKGERSEKVIRQSTDITAQIKQIKVQADELDGLHKTQAEKMEKQKLKAKNKITPEIEEEIKKRGEIVDLTYRHIEELKHLEKQGYKGRASEVDTNRLTDAAIAPSKLPDIDDPQFQVLRDNDALISAKLELVLTNVKTLGAMADEMGKELDKQEQIIDVLNTKADNVQDKMENLNKRMKKTLDSVRTCDRFIIDFICIVIILALALYLYNSFS